MSRSAKRFCSKPTNLWAILIKAESFNALNTIISSIRLINSGLNNRLTSSITEEAATILSEYYEIEQKDVLDALKNMPPTNKIVGYDKQAQLLFDAGILTKQPTKFDDLENYEKIVK